MEERIATLRRILDGSAYTVALCGSGMMEEGGFGAIKGGDRAYEIEQKYGYSPDEIFTSGFYTANGAEVFVSRGIGNSGPSFRLFNRPQVAVLTLTREEGAA